MLQSYSFIYSEQRCTTHYQRNMREIYRHEIKCVYTCVYVGGAWKKVATQWQLSMHIILKLNASQATLTYITYIHMRVYMYNSKQYINPHENLKIYHVFIFSLSYNAPYLFLSWNIIENIHQIDILDRNPAGIMASSHFWRRHYYMPKCQLYNYLLY